MRYLITLSYDGAAYHGWQVQPNGKSVEGTLESALSMILRYPVDIVGAGRTDAGVNARMMAAHFDVESALADTGQLVYKLNRLLPPDIAVQSLKPVGDDFHARFSAVSRTYRYYVHTGKNPFLRSYSYQCHYALDFDEMNRAASVIMSYRDFACFCKSHTDVKTTLCEVTEARWVKVACDEYYFEITANRFLRNMVRAVVGTLIDVGRGKLNVDDVRTIIEGHCRSDAGESMPANALTLYEINYGHTDEL